VPPGRLPAGRLRRGAEQWRALHADRRFVRGLLAVNLLAWLVSAVRIYASFRLFGIIVPPAACGLLAACVSVSRLVNLLPGNLGIKEAVLVAAAGAQGLDVNGALHAAVVDRLVEMALTLGVGSHFAWRLARPSRAAQDA